MSAERRRRDRVRIRRALTLESHQRAVVEFDQYGLLPGPRPSVMGRWQRRLEHHILTRLGRGPVACDWPWPAGTVLGIRSVTLRPDLLLVDLDPDAVLPTLHSLLPVTRYRDAQSRDLAVSVMPTGHRATTMRYYDTTLIDTVSGVPGLRVKPTRAGLELSLLGQDRDVPGTVVLRAVTADVWTAVSDQLLESYDGHEEPDWFHRPDHFGSHEHNSFQAFTQSYTLPSDARASGLLRRIGLLRDHQVRAVDIDTAVGDGPIFDVLGWPPRRTNELAVRIDPELGDSVGGVGPAAWVACVPQEDTTVPTAVPLRGLPWSGAGRDDHRQ